MNVLINCANNPGVCFIARALRTWGERLCGLLGAGRHAQPVLLIPCASIHTFGMAYPIDVAFLDAKGAVIKACRALPPKRQLSCWSACAVLERPASAAPWPVCGQLLQMEECSHDR